MSSPKRMRTMPRPAPRSVVGSARDVDVLANLVWAGYLSTSQIQRLHFPSRRRAQRRMRALLDHHVVRAHLQAGALERENVYVATPRGVDLVLEAGIEARAGARLPRISKLAHGLATRDAFVEALLWKRAAPGREVDVRFEGELSRHPVLRAAGIVPDLLVELRRGESRVELFVEVDLGTETTTTLREKLARWHSYFASAGESSRLLVAASRTGRVTSIARLVEQAGLPARCRVVGLSELASTLDAWPHPSGAASGRTERTPLVVAVPSNAPPAAPGASAFRPRRR